MRDPRDTALHAKFLWKGLEEEKGRNFWAFWNRGGLFLLLLCSMYVGPDAATAYADVTGPWTSKMGPVVVGWSGKSLQGQCEEAYDALRLGVETLSSSNTVVPPTLPMGSLLVGCFQTGDGAPLSQHLPIDSSEWSLRWIHEHAIKIISWMRQGSRSFQGFSVLKGTFPELCGSPLLLLFVAFDDSVNFWMLQFLQMGLIVIVTWLDIQ